MALTNIDYWRRNRCWDDKVMQHIHSNGGTCDIGQSRSFIARFAVFQAQHRKCGCLFAIRHRGGSLSHVLQAGIAGIGCNGLLPKQHEAEGAGGEPFPEIAGEMHGEMLGSSRRISK